ncbi:hypothetical protein [Mesorhizobium sp. M0698]|uniref:hypothetical protein n=1 Tax=Mesorhizobium sp. M0698 TaxID=2956987 RepID=UPI00333DA789
MGKASKALLPICARIECELASLQESGRMPSPIVRPGKAIIPAPRLKRTKIDKASDRDNT